MSSEKEFHIIDYGAVPNTATVQTPACQACIDACAAAGGGRVIVSAGRFTIGSIRLASRVTLVLETGAVLCGSPQLQDYTDFDLPPALAYVTDPHFIHLWHLPPHYFHALITAADAEYVSIVGATGSIIDGQNVQDPAGEEGFRGPMGIVFSRCRHVALDGYTFQNSANWSHALLACQDVKIGNVTILAGHDGFNLHHSRDIVIRDCRLETGDDCLAGYDMAHLQVTNCSLNTACNALRLGGSHLHVTDCVFRGPGVFPHLSENNYDTHAVFKYYAMTADQMAAANRDIVLTNCLVSTARRFLTYNYDDPTGMQSGTPLQELTLSGLSIQHIAETSIFKGNGALVSLTLEDCRITPTPGVSFLAIDHSVQLRLSSVYFTAPTTIRTTSDQQWTFTGMTDTAVNQ